MSSVSRDTQYEMPDGQEINLERERFRCPELLFNPSAGDIDAPGIHEICYNSIKTCNLDIRAELYANIILAGGNTLFTGLSKRLQKELDSLTLDYMDVKVLHHPEGRYCAWIGGSILSSLSVFEEMPITREKYDEFGPGVVHLNCYHSI